MSNKFASFVFDFRYLCIMDIEYRIARADDFPSVWKIILQAKARMQAEGRRQWDDTYPLPADIHADISCANARVLCHGGEVMAYGAVIYDGEEVYGRLRGQWLTAGPYVVLHRLAVADTALRRGMALRFISEVSREARGLGIPSFRVDTRHDNAVMLRIFSRMGFIHCGEVTYRDTERRLAFELLL